MSEIKTPALQAETDAEAEAKPSLKERLAARWLAFKHRAGFHRTTPLSALEKIFAGCVLASMFFAMGVLIFVGRAALHMRHGETAQHSSEAHDGEGEETSGGGEGSDHAESSEEHGGEHDGEGETSVITQATIPKSILARQDGKIDEGQDLVEPEIQRTRGLAALLKRELQVEGPPKYVNLFEIISATRGSDTGDAVVIGDFVLVLTDFDGQEEVKSKLTQFKALVGSLIANRTREDLRSLGGKSGLKSDIQREINHQLSKGQVKDVLFSKFIVR